MAKVDTTLAVSSALNALGVKGGELPQLETSFYQPVMVMADLSKNLSSEPIEARGFAGYFITAGSGSRSGAFQLQCISRGGLVIETLFLSLPQYAGVGGFFVCCRETTPQPFLSGRIPYMQAGGRDARSLVDVDTLITSISQEVVIPIEVGARSWAAENLRLYVPAGSFFKCQAGINATAFTFTIQWRELADVLGGSA